MGEEENKEFNALEGTQAGVVVESAPKSTPAQIKAKEDKAQRQQNIDDTIAKETTPSTSVWDKVGEDVGKAKEAMHQRSGVTLGSGSFQEAESTKPKEKPYDWGKDLGKVQQRYIENGEIDKLNELNALMASVIGGQKYVAASAFTKQRTDFLKDSLAVTELEIKKAKSQYFLTKGEINRAGIEAMGEGMVNKSKTSSKALDQLQEQGAGQLDMEDIPPNDRAVLAQVISTSIADTFKNIFGMVEGGTTGAATALSDDAGVVGYQQAATMLATNVAESRARKDKVAMINFELEEKWKGDVVKAMSEFENRASVEERFYQTQRMSAIAMEYSHAFKLLGMEQRMLEMEGNIRGSMDTDRTNVSRTNASGQNQIKAAKIRAMGAVRAQMIARDRADKVERDRRITGLRSLVGAGVNMAATGIPWTHLAGSVVHTYSIIPEKSLHGQDSGIGNAAAGRGADIINKIQRMVSNGMTPKQANVAVNNVLMMADKGYLPNNMSDEFIGVISDEAILPNTEYQIIMASKPNLVGGFTKSGNFAPSVMNMTIMQLLSAKGSQYYKNVKKGDYSPANFNAQLWGQ